MHGTIVPTRWRGCVALSVAVLCMLLWLTPLGASTADTGELRGKLVSGTPGFEVPAGLTVDLFYCSQVDSSACFVQSNLLDTPNMGGEQILRSTTVAADNTFVFTDVPTDRACRIVVQLYIESPRYLPTLDLANCTVAEPLSIAVHQQTQSLDSISLEVYSMFLVDINRRDQELSFLAFVTLVNGGDQVYITDLGDPELTGLKLLRFNLPENYTDLFVDTQLPEGSQLEINTGFALTTPVPPGRYETAIRFSAPYADQKLAFPLRLPFGAATFNLLLPADTGMASGTELTRLENVTVEGTQTVFQNYRGSYARGSQVDLLIDGLPNPSFNDHIVLFLNGPRLGTAVAVLLGALIVLVLGLILLLRWRTRQAVEALLPPDLDSLGRSQIVELIAELDARKIGGRAYKQARERLAVTAIRRRDV